MKASAILQDFFKDHDYHVIEEFLKSFSIDYYLLSVGDSVNFRIPDNKNMDRVAEYDGCFFTNTDKENRYMIAIFDQTEDEVIDKFNRFLNVRIFL